MPTSNSRQIQKTHFIGKNWIPHFVDFVWNFQILVFTLFVDFSSWKTSLQIKSIWQDNSRHIMHYMSSGKYRNFPLYIIAFVSWWLTMCVGVPTHWFREAPFYAADKVTSTFSPSRALPLTCDPLQSGVTRGVRGHPPDPTSLVYHDLWFIRLWQACVLVCVFVCCWSVTLMAFKSETSKTTNSTCTVSWWMLSLSAPKTT